MVVISLILYVKITCCT